MATLSEAYTSTPLNLHHIIPLDFDSVKHVPESHSWPISTLDDFLGREAKNGEKISLPTIDLNCPNSTEMLQEACETWGMFQVINHGIPSSLLRDVESEARKFFSLPAVEKIKALRTPGGANGYGIARITPFFDKFMWHEGFTIVGSPVEHAREVWPNGYQGFCEVMDDYQKKMKALSERLLNLILKSLNLQEDEETVWPPRSGFGGSIPCTALQLNSYPACPDPTRAMGLAPHRDSFLLTILHQSNINGLQVQKEGLGWVNVVPSDGALVVNVGDMLHIMSDAQFPSVLHRAVVNEISHRLSIAYFYGPPTDFRITPIQRSVRDRPPQFRSVTVRDYIVMKAENLENALSLISTV